MGNYCQQQFENIPDAFSERSELQRVDQTKVNPNHCAVYEPEPVLAPSATPLLDQELLHSTIRRRPI